MIDWVIQTDVFDKQENDKLISAVINSGSRCRFIDKNTWKFGEELYTGEK